MNCAAVKLVYFSPTQTTKRVLEGIAEGIEAPTVEHLDLTAPLSTTLSTGSTNDELVILGVPVYGGRVPLAAVPRLRKLKGSKTPAVIVVVYGNREFEDALIELKDMANDLGFIPIAGAAFIGEHSFSSDTVPIADGRPDTTDIEKARAFGSDIREKLKHMESVDTVPRVDVPGNRPYKDWKKPAEISPSTQKDLCTLCGTCASSCPVEAIVVEETVETSKKDCILCCACVKNCPTGARVGEEPLFKQMAEWLSTNCQKRKEPEIFL